MRAFLVVYETFANRLLFDGPENECIELRACLFLQ